MNASCQLKSLLIYYSTMSLICMPLNAYIPVGLKAPGNSCYMNSLLQILASIEPLNQKLSTLTIDYYRDQSDQLANKLLDTNKTEASKEIDLKELPQKLQLAQAVLQTIRAIHKTHKESISSAEVWTHLQPIMQKKTGRAQGSQEDTTEAWLAVLDALSLDDSVLKVIHDNLAIRQIDQRTSRTLSSNSPLLFESGTYNTTDHTYHNFSNFAESIAYNLFNNPNKIESISSYFSFCVPRVYQNQENSTIKKDITPMIPMTSINLKDCVGKTPHNEFIYHLHAFAVHHGSEYSSGHYTAYIRGQDAWYNCNDASITKIGDETAMLQGTAPGIYLLVYKQGPAPQFKQVTSKDSNAHNNAVENNDRWQQYINQQSSQSSINNQRSVNLPRRQSGLQKKLQESLAQLAQSFHELVRTLND